MAEYIPPTEEVREAFAWSGHDNYLESNRLAKQAAFDRWLIAHDCAVAARTLEEASTGEGFEEWVMSLFSDDPDRDFTDWLAAKARKLRAVDGVDR